MNETTKPVETKPEGAGGQAGVETTTKAPESETDFLDVFQKTIEERDKAVKIAEDWKRVGLAKKRGHTVEAPVELTEDDVEQRAQERAEQIANERSIRSNQQKAEEIALKALKENRELKIALKNKSGVVTTGTTTSTATTEVKTNPTGWTPEQAMVLKKQGVDPVKAWENYLKLKP